MKVELKAFKAYSIDAPGYTWGYTIFFLTKDVEVDTNKIAIKFTGWIIHRDDFKAIRKITEFGEQILSLYEDAEDTIIEDISFNINKIDDKFIQDMVKDIFKET